MKRLKITFALFWVWVLGMLDPDEIRFVLKEGYKELERKRKDDDSG